MIRVMKVGQPNTIAALEINVSRPSILGNPYRIGDGLSREDVIERYRQWLRKHWSNGPQDEVRQALESIALLHHEGHDIHLICYCAPKPCHGDIIKDAAEKIAALITEKGA